jgi:sugar phosphate permease
MVINHADKAVIGLSSVPIMRDLKLSSREFGELGSAFFPLFFVSGVAFGFLANHVRTKRLMVFMALAWGLPLLPLGFRSGFGLLLASRAIHGVYKCFGDRQRALPTSIVACGGAFGTGVIAPLAPVLAWPSQTLTRRGWSTRLSRGVLGALCVVTAGVAMLCMCLLEFGNVKVCFRRSAVYAPRWSWGNKRRLT